MPPRSPLEYDVSVAAANARRLRKRGHSGAFEQSTHTCTWPDCTAQGLYRAPVSPDRLGEYRWFCLEHVRIYNENWNFFSDLSEEEFDLRLRTATTWERPTWTLGGGPQGPRGLHGDNEGRAWARFGFSDPFDVLGAAATINRPEAAPATRTRRLTGTERHALEVLGLGLEVTDRADVRRRHRELVKDLHPDSNGGAAPEPERLAAVLRAWEILRESPNFDD
ncbi:MAG: DnaJ family molecular chaperone [Paracoccaceae bacterium]